jgi:2-polyprenyl-3-methyl-5-hydroxy-6-metoxy-1,4-benzoquinol methylase
MNLLELTNRPSYPEPWSEGDNIPWSDPDFSERMLKEHLSQDHDAASRRGEIIDQHVAWIHSEVLSGASSKALDLGCGPGLYTSRLAKLGHECVGIDYSPASVAYAAEHARGEDLRCEYRQEDIREAEYGESFGLVMLINGELNVFAPEDAKGILRKCHAALDDDQSADENADSVVDSEYLAA